MEELRLRRKSDIDALRRMNKDDGVNWKQIAISVIVAIGLYIAMSSEIDKFDARLIAMEQKLDVTLYDYTSYRKSAEALNSTACAQCHINAGMILPKSSLDQAEFIAYVRGTKRFNTNNQMPRFTADMISDAQLEAIWKKLY
jgi:hypothetical protein